jgi:hypothetical protein
MVKVGHKQRWKSKHRQCRRRLSKMQARWDAACSGNSRPLQSGPKPCWLLYKEELKEGNGSGRIPSSPALGCSRCPMPIAWRANPGAETTDWRARRGRTAQRVRREGMASAIPYPYPSTHCCLSCSREAVIRAPLQPSCRTAEVSQLTTSREIVRPGPPVLAAPLSASRSL